MVPIFGRILTRLRFANALILLETRRRENLENLPESCRSTIRQTLLDWPSRRWTFCQALQREGGGDSVGAGPMPDERIDGNVHPDHQEGQYYLDGRREPLRVEQ